MAHYIALLRKDDDSDFGVEFPDFPGCVTAGTSLDDAAKMAAEALALHVEGLLEDGEDIPEPSALDLIASRRATRGAVPFLVSVPDPAKRAVRVNVTFYQDILDEIDEHAEGEGLSRSAFLARAAVKAIRNTRRRSKARTKARRTTG